MSSPAETVASAEVKSSPMTGSDVAVLTGTLLTVCYKLAQLFFDATLI